MKLHRPFAIVMLAASAASCGSLAADTVHAKRLGPSVEVPLTHFHVNPTGVREAAIRPAPAPRLDKLGSDSMSLPSSQTPLREDTVTRAAAEPVIAGSQPVSQAELDRGRYLVRVGGCNDCHTAGYVAMYGGVPEEDWLLGGDVAYRGRWGTSFATNLRLTMLRFNDEQWLGHARTLDAREPMPVERLHAMSDADLLSILRFVQWLGPRGEPAPLPLPPGDEWIGESLSYIPPQR